MKRIFLILAIALFSASLFSCAREDEKLNMTGTDGVELGDADFLGIIEDVVNEDGTKAVLSSDYIVQWCIGDQISVNKAVYQVVGLKSPTEAYFKHVAGKEWETSWYDKSHFCAFFPAEMHAHHEYGYFPMNIEYDPKSKHNLLPMYAEGENHVLKFKNISSLLHFHIEKGDTARGIQIMCNSSWDAKLYGGFYVVKDGGTGDYSMKMTGEDFDVPNLLVEFPDGGVTDCDVYIPVPPGRYYSTNFFYTMGLDSIGQGAECHNIIRAALPYLDLKSNTIYDIPAVAKVWSAESLLTESYRLMAQSLGYDCTGDFSPLFVLQNFCGSDVMVAGCDGHSDLSGLNTFNYSNDCEMMEKIFYGIFSTIHSLNFLMQNYQEETGEVEKRCVAEARTLRAYCYFLLSQYWYRPFLIENLVVDDYDYAPSDMTVRDWMLWCAKECEAAVADLSERESKSDRQGAMKVTKGFANALAGKCYLFAGEYASAKTSLKKVIDSGKYELVPGDKFASLYHSEGNGCEEKIFDLPCVPDYEDLALLNWRSSSFAADPTAVYTGGVRGAGCLGVRQEFAAALYNNDGDSYRFNASVMHIRDAVYSDYMKYVDPDINRMSYDERKASDRVGIRTEGMPCQSFWLPKKYLSIPSDMGARNYTVMRYAEVLLMYAEACVNTGVWEALTYLNQIQNRAGSKTMSSSPTLDNVKGEYSYELFLDGGYWLNELRWSDSRTTGKTETLAKNRTVTHLYDKLHRPVQGGETPIWENGSEGSSRFYLLKEELGTDNLERYLYLPYPKTFVSRKASRTVQAPGW